MCLAIPGRVVEISGNTARVDFGGVTREANLALVPEAMVDSYVLVHAGFAIQVLSETEAEETLALFRDLAAALDDERTPPGHGGTAPSDGQTTPGDGQERG
jgi:hydrogenase expression/formation protein HypC